MRLRSCAQLIHNEESGRPEGADFDPRGEYVHLMLQQPKFGDLSDHKYPIPQPEALIGITCNRRVHRSMSNSPILLTPQFFNVRRSTSSPVCPLAVWRDQQW